METYGDDENVQRGRIPRPPCQLEGSIAQTNSCHATALKALQHSITVGTHVNHAPKIHRAAVGVSTTPTDEHYD